MIPEHLLADKNWRGMLYILTNSDNLTRAVSPHIDLEECSVDFPAIKRISKPWSNAEKFLLNLAMHLFSEQYKVNLSDMDLLDTYNKEIALKAIRLRFG